MDSFLALFDKVDVYIAAVTGVLTALIAFFMLIPGDQPEKSLQKALNFIKKFSRKK